MKTSFVLKLLKDRRSRASEQKWNLGFTLTELLVAILISGVIVTSLLALVVELLGSDQREAVRTETQQEMQAAMDFIAEEMRESVYIYDGECLAGLRAGCSGLFNGSNPGGLPIPTNSVPIFAFWKLDPLPKQTRDYCLNNLDAAEAAGIPCLSNRMYTLVVYFLSKKDPGNPWKGRARIMRYELPRYTDASWNTPLAGYIDPTDSSTSFGRWPLDPNPSNNYVSKNPNPGTPNATQSPIQVLVDYVDDRNSAQLSSVIGRNFTIRDCPPVDYRITPNISTLNAYGFPDVRSIYACVRLPEEEVSGSGSGFNQKIVLFLRGSTSGKPGVDVGSGKEVLPTLQTEVLNRGVREKTPDQS